MGSNATKYVVVNENTLCFRQHRSQMLGVMAANIHGRDWRQGPILIGQHDVLRPATEEDFRRFRHVLPSDFGKDASAGHHLTIVEMTAAEHEAMKAADGAFQQELVRVYGESRAGDCRYLPRYADGELQAAKDRYVDASTLWHNALAEARRLVSDRDGRDVA